MFFPVGNFSYLPFMKGLLVFTGIILILASCSEISYKEPQPTGVKMLSQIPAKLQGNYRIEENGEADTLVVMATGYRIGQDDVAQLSDSLVLKYYKGYYFFNIRDKFSWYLRIVKLQKNGDLLYLEMDDIPESEGEREAFLKHLREVVPVIITEGDNKTYYVIDPAPKKLLELIKKGYFNEQTFTRIR
jgi:hypothetical protein